MSALVERGSAVVFSYSGSAGLVEIAGDFTGWHLRKLTRSEDNRWEIEFSLEPGEYQYKFLVDGRWVSGTAENARGAARSWEVLDFATGSVNRKLLVH